MSSHDDYRAAKEPADRLSGGSSADASQGILLSEYAALLRAIEPLRMVNRTVLIGLTLVQCLLNPTLLSKQVLLLIVSALACAFWFLQEFVTGKKLGRLGELIATTNADVMAGAEPPNTRPIVLPPKKESQTEQMIGPASDKKAINRDTLSTSYAQLWTNSYIGWRQEAWKSRRILILQHSEPIAWFVLILATEAYRLLMHR